MEKTTDDKKVLGNWLDKFPEMIREAGKGLKSLFALIILAAVTFLVLALFRTPPSSGNYTLIILVLAVILLVVMFILFFDRKDARHVKMITTVEMTAGKELQMRETIVKKQNVNQNFVDNTLGFKIYNCTDEGWQKPTSFTHKENLMRLSPALNNMAADILINQLRVSSPFGNMVASSKNVFFQFGKNIEIEFTEATTRPEIENIIAKRIQAAREFEHREPSQDEIAQFRKTIVMEGGPVKINFGVSLNVSVLNKEVIPGVKVNLPNLFQEILGQTRESINQLKAEDNSIICITQTSFLNVKVNGTLENFMIYRTYKMIESKDKIYILQIQWAPQSESAPEVWEELKKMMESFEMIS